MSHIHVQVVIHAERIYTMADGDAWYIDNGVMLVRDGKVAAVGANIDLLHRLSQSLGHVVADLALADVVLRLRSGGCQRQGCCQRDEVAAQHGTQSPDSGSKGSGLRATT